VRLGNAPEPTGPVALSVHTGKSEPGPPGSNAVESGMKKGGLRLADANAGRYYDLRQPTLPGKRAG
jgi:hypothetical protein